MAANPAPRDTRGDTRGNPLVLDADGRVTGAAVLHIVQGPGRHLRPAGSALTNRRVGTLALERLRADKRAHADEADAERAAQEAAALHARQAALENFREGYDAGRVAAAERAQRASPSAVKRSLEARRAAADELGRKREEERRAHRESRCVVREPNVPVVPRRRRRHARRITGSREFRFPPLNKENLFLTEDRPPKQKIVPEHHMCSLCKSLKSHPVSYACGHSHCYVCVRLWLERSWACPTCKRTMHAKPFRHYAEEKSVAAASARNDDSVVDYSFEGLVFPQLA